MPMPTRYQQLCQLSDRVRQQENKRHDEACSLANLLLNDLISSFDIPENLHSGPVNKTLAIEVCGVPEAGHPLRRNVSLKDAVTTHDGDNFIFGVVMRTLSGMGFAPHVVLFRVHMRHKLNDTFEVRVSGTDIGPLSAGDSQPLPRQFSDTVFQLLKDYFTAGVVEQPQKRPVGFEILPQDA